MEVGVAGANPVNPMLAHKNGRVRVMDQVPGQKWQFGNHFSGHLRMSRRGDQNSKPG